MEGKTREMLDEVIEDMIERIQDPYSDEDKELATQRLAILYKMKIEEDRTLAEAEHKVFDRKIRIILESAGIVLPLMFYSIWMSKGFKFEESGTYTSNTFRGLFNKFRPTTF